jgi:AraC-like DNA-binding protein
MEHLTVAAGTSFRVRLRREPGFAFEWHFHPEYELTLITAGGGRRFVGDTIESYQPGDLVLVGPELPHTWQSDSPGWSEAVVIQFRRDFLGPDLWRAPEFAGTALLLTRASRGLAFPPGPGEPLRALATEPDATRRLLGLFHVLVTLSTVAGRPLASEGYAPHLDEHARRRIDAVCRYIAEHHTGPVTLSDAARVANLTPAAFCRFFRRATGHTLTGYLTLLRIGTARRQLIETDHPVAQIAADCGFASLSHFNRTFRRLTGGSPREFRRAYPSGTRLARAPGPDAPAVTGATRPDPGTGTRG